jgi:precorrin-2 dehydrogenase / sirohydrochlorin ferrochelatase
MVRFAFPIHLELAGRRCVVASERAVDEGKVAGLLAGGADDVLVVAEGPLGRLDELESDPRVTVERRGWRPSDLDGAYLLIAWAEDPAERDRMANEARSRGVIVNVIDDIPNCDFAAPAIVRRGDLLIGISTGGRSPTLASRVRVELSDRFGPEWAGILDVLGEARAETLPDLPDMADRARRWRRALDLDEAQELARRGQLDLLKSRLLERLTEVPA